jgi:ATP-dependent Lon protease
MDADASLPLFPLGLVCYPGEPVPLHIFEFRYREMVRVCEDEGRPFGIVYSRDDAWAEVGCTARIRKVLARYEDGRLDIVTEGERRFRVEAVHEIKPYLTADVSDFGPREETVDRRARERAIAQHMRLVEVSGETLRPQLYQGRPLVSYFIARRAGLGLPEQQEVLELPTENERLAYLSRHLERAIPELEGRLELRRRIQSNGHAKP